MGKDYGLRGCGVDDMCAAVVCFLWRTNYPDVERNTDYSRCGTERENYDRVKNRPKHISLISCLLIYGIIYLYQIFLEHGFTRVPNLK